MQTTFDPGLKHLRLLPSQGLGSRGGTNASSGLASLGSSPHRLPGPHLGSLDPWSGRRQVFYTKSFCSKSLLGPNLNVSKDAGIPATSRRAPGLVSGSRAPGIPQVGYSRDLLRGEAPLLRSRRRERRPLLLAHFIRLLSHERESGSLMTASHHLMSSNRLYSLVITSIYVVTHIITCK